MQLRQVVPSIIAAAALGACAPAGQVAETGAALTVRAPIDATPGALVVGSSDDRRWIAYATSCAAGGGDGTPAAPTLKVLDDWTGAIATLGAGRCWPGSVHFSPDGRLLVYPGADGLRAHDNVSGRTAVLAAMGESLLTVGFSPDGRWFAVAVGEPPTALRLEAWDADLVHHVTIADHAYADPSGIADRSIIFSRGGARLLFLADVDGPFPVGTLTEWTRATGQRRVLGTGVAAWVVAGDDARVAMLDGVTADPTRPPSEWLHGRLAVRALDGDRLDVVEADVSAQPLRFTPNGALLYFAGPISSPRLTLRAWSGGAPVTIDEDVFRGFSVPTSVAMRGDGAALAYLTRFDPQHGAGELHVAELPAPGRPAAAPTVVARDALPMGFGWVGASVGYLRATPASGGFSPVGTLTVWKPGAGNATIAKQVGTPGLRFDDARGRIVYVDHYDGQRAAGDLHVWSACSGRRRLVGRDAMAMSIALSPDGNRVGWLAVGDAPPDGQPPMTLRVGTLAWPAPTRTVADDVSSFVLPDGGRVLYTNDDGLFDAFAL